MGVSLGGHLYVGGGGKVPSGEKYSATEQESRFLPPCGFCSVLWLNLHVSLFDLIPS